MVRLISFLAVSLGVLGGCASPVFDVGRSETVLPLVRAWVDGRVVEYVTTDISDAAMAEAMGANYVPRLAQAARALPGQSLLERVYRFPNDEQISIFQSAPQPAGGLNQDRSYSPLWRVVLVRWESPRYVRELKSEESLLEAEAKRELSLEVTDIVVNCPVTRDGAGRALRGVR